MKNDSSFKVPTGIKIALGVSMIIFGVIVYSIWPFLSFSSSLFSQYIKHDDVVIKDSPFLKRSILVGPPGRLAKMKNYGSWTDRYYHLITNYTKNLDSNSNIISHVDLEDIHTFEVFEVRTITSGQGFSVGTICILKDLKDSKIVLSVYCNDIERINLATDFYTKANVDLKSYKSFYATLRVGINQRQQTPVFKINNSETYLLKSFEEYFTLLSDNPYHISYTEDFLNPPYFMKERSNLNEEEFYKFLYKSEYDLSSRISAKDLFDKNTLPHEIHTKIHNLFPDSLVNRWILKTIYLSHKEGLITKAYVNCLSRNLEGTDDFSVENFKVKEFLTFTGIGNDIKDRKDTDHFCERLSPPKILGEVNISGGSF